MLEAALQNGAKFQPKNFSGFLNIPYYGNVIYVDSVNGSDTANSGTSPDKAVASIAQAVTLATANNNDVIILMPGHVESIATATALTLSKAGVRIIGLGTGSRRPTITYTTAATATINVSAANVRIENVIFVANFADVAAAFTTTTAKSLQLVDCEFRDTASNLNFVTIIDTNATSNDTDGLHLERVKWFGLTATTNSTVIKMDGTNTRLFTKDCYFAQAAVTAGGFMIIATGKVVTNAIIDNNVFNLVGATGLTTGTLITTDGTTNSGILMNNKVFELDATTEILVTASSGFVFMENKSSAVADKSGYLLPAADA
jgi:hypothetical protein